MATKYVLKIDPKISADDARKTESQLNSRFAKVAKNYGDEMRKQNEKMTTNFSSHMKLALGKLKVGWVALAGAVASVLTNPFDEVDAKLNELLSKFTKEQITNYSIFMDSNDKILIKTNSIISTNDYFAIVAPSVLGKTVGNKVGDICINKEINIVGSDEKFSAIDNKGKIVIINFWYTSCTPCVQELPHFDEMQKKYSDDVVVIAIHEASIYNSNPDAVKEFIESQFDGFEILFGYDDLESQYYSMLGGKQAWPMTIIVDQEGVVSFVKQGSLTSSALEEEIVKLLG